MTSKGCTYIFNKKALLLFYHYKPIINKEIKPNSLPKHLQLQKFLMSEEEYIIRRTERSQFTGNWDAVFSSEHTYVEVVVSPSANCGTMSVERIQANRRSNYHYGLKIRVSNEFRS